MKKKVTIQVEKQLCEKNFSGVHEPSAKRRAVIEESLRDIAMEIQSVVQRG